METQTSLTLLLEFCKGIHSPISVHNLPRLCSSIDLMKENGLTLKKARSRTIMDADYMDDIAILSNTPTQAKSLLHSLEQAAGDISLHVNADKMEYMWFNQEGGISTLNGGSLKLMDKFTYLGSSILSTENRIGMQLAKA